MPVRAPVIRTTGGFLEGVFIREWLGLNVGGARDSEHLAYKRTFVIFRFLLCSHESSLPTKEKIISRALAHPVGLLRQAALPASSLDCSQISSTAADEEEKTRNGI